MRVLVRGDLYSYEKERFRKILEAAGHIIEFGEFSANADALLIGGEPLDDSSISSMPNLKYVIRFARGRHNLDQEKALFARSQIKYRNVKGISAPSTAEHALMLILAHLKRLPDAIVAKQIGSWKQSALCEQGIKSLRGSTVGLIGLGSVGRILAEQLVHLGAKILYNKSTPLSDEEEKALRVEWAPQETLLRKSEVISMQARTPDGGSPILAADQFKMMRPDVVLVNVGGGHDVDIRSLQEFLNNNPASVAIDVFPDEPFNIPRNWRNNSSVLITPHIGGRSEIVSSELARISTEALTKISNSENLGLNIQKEDACNWPILSSAVSLYEGNKPLQKCEVVLPEDINTKFPNLQNAIDFLGARVSCDEILPISNIPILIDQVGQVDLDCGIAAKKTIDKVFSVSAIPSWRHLLTRWGADYTIWNEILPSDGSGSIAGQEVCIDGYGLVERVFAWRARELGMIVKVHDDNPENAIDALYDGFDSVIGKPKVQGLSIRSSAYRIIDNIKYLHQVPDGLRDETAAAILISIVNFVAAQTSETRISNEQIFERCSYQLVSSIIQARS